MALVQQNIKQLKLKQQFKSLYKCFLGHLQHQLLLVLQLKMDQLWVYALKYMLFHILLYILYTAGVDYIPILMQPVLLTPVATTSSLTITIIADEVDESDETFFVTIAILQAGIPIRLDPARAAVRITDGMLLHPYFLLGLCILAVYEDI